MTLLICFPIPTTVSPAFQLPLHLVAPNTLLSYIAHPKWSKLAVVLLQGVTNNRFHLWHPAPWVPFCWVGTLPTFGYMQFTCLTTRFAQLECWPIEVAGWRD